VIHIIQCITDGKDLPAPDEGIVSSEAAANDVVVKDSGVRTKSDRTIRIVGSSTLTTHRADNHAAS